MRRLRLPNRELREERENIARKVQNGRPLSTKVPCLQDPVSRSSSKKPPQINKSKEKLKSEDMLVDAMSNQPSDKSTTFENNMSMSVHRPFNFKVRRWNAKVRFVASIYHRVLITFLLHF